MLRLINTKLSTLLITNPLKFTIYPYTNVFYSYIFNCSGMVSLTALLMETESHSYK